MTKKLIIGTGIAALAALAVVGLARRGDSQPSGTPATLTVGIYAPSAPFAGSQARLEYVNGLAAAIAANTGAQVQGLSFTSMGQLRGRKVDFAIIEGQCYSSNPEGKLLANSKIKGGDTRPWALYSSEGASMTALKGKRLAFVKMGCNDNGFIENAMLESEVTIDWFSARVGKPDVSAAVAEVVSRKGAEAVFAPVGSQKGLTKVFDTGAVPNPAFVQLNTKLSKELAAKVAKAVTSYGGGGAITGWDDANPGVYKSLQGRMGRRVKQGMFTSPSPVRVDDKDVLIWPKTIDDTDLTDVGQHFEAPPARQE